MLPRIIPTKSKASSVMVNEKMTDDTPKARNDGKGGNLKEPPPSASDGAAPLGGETNLDNILPSPPTSPIDDGMDLSDKLDTSFDTADSEVLLARMDAANKSRGTHTSPPPSMKKPNHVKYHNRMVSWGGIGGEPPSLGGKPSPSGLGSGGAAEDLSIFSSNFQSFVRVNPFESEAVSELMFCTHWLRFLVFS